MSALLPRRLSRRSKISVRCAAFQMLSDSGCRILDAKVVHQSGGAPQNFLGHFFLAQVAETILWRFPEIEPSGQNAGNQSSKSQWVSFSHLGQNRRPMLSPSSMHVANEILGKPVA